MSLDIQHVFVGELNVPVGTQPKQQCTAADIQQMSLDTKLTATFDFTMI